ncbi:MAG: hypothetical protein LBQ58_01125 [Synergistaceae bacterium]|jgi:hypothetical protein|nr:hypothetical protein [Synergistaceae bacterium]
MKKYVFLFLLMIFMSMAFAKFSYKEPWDFSGAVEVTRMFISLDYIASLAKSYIEETGSLQDGEVSVIKAVKILKRDEKALDIAKPPGEYHKYVHMKGDVVDYSDMTSILANRFLMLWASSTRSISFDDSIEHFHFNYFNIIDNSCLFKNSIGINDKGNISRYLYIGYKMHFPGKSGEYARECVKVIASMRNGYYFQDSSGTPYVNGDAILIRLEISK